MDTTTVATMYNGGTSDATSSASFDPRRRAAQQLFRFENVPFCRWHTKARIVMGSATLFDAFDALSLAFVMPVLVGLWHLSPGENRGPDRRGIPWTGHWGTVLRLAGRAHGQGAE